jgi:Family of unknown function (DUF6152)
MRLMRNLIGAVAVVACIPALAHHSFAMFDQTKTLTIEGTVAKYEWSNPHMHVRILVPKALPGIEAGEWDAEGASTNIASREGWSRSTFNVGDKITVSVHPLRDGSKGGSLMFAIAPDGRKLYHDINRQEGGGPKTTSN